MSDGMFSAIRISASGLRGQRTKMDVVARNLANAETTRTGEVISRLTTDTTLLQSVVGSTLATSVRNLLLIVGGIAMLLITSLKLTLLVLVGVPLVVVPVWLLGHRVRRLSRISQDRIADVAASVDEVLYGIRTVQAFRHEAMDRRVYGGHVESAFAAATTVVSPTRSGSGARTPPRATTSRRVRSIAASSGARGTTTARSRRTCGSRRCSQRSAVTRSGESRVRELLAPLRFRSGATTTMSARARKCRARHTRPSA